MKNEYPDSKSDLFAAFIERVAAMVNRHGLMAQVTMQSWMFLSSYEKLRVKLQSNASIVAMLHMDNMVMRIAFGTAATVWEVGGPSSRAGRYTYFETADLDGDAPRTFPAHNERTAKANHGGYFEVSQKDFEAIPGSPIVYWLSEKMRSAFRKGTALGEIAEPRQGMATADNGRFVRQWWEVSRSRTAFECGTRDDAVAGGARWFPYTDGGEFRRWYGNRHAVVNWEKDGAELQAFERSAVRNPGFYFRESLTWSAVGSGVPAFRSVPAGSIFSNAGMSAFAASQVLAQLAAICNSAVAEALFGAIAPTLNLGVGEIGKLPVLKFAPNSAQTVPGLIAESRDDWESVETSWNFEGNPLVKAASRTAT